MTTDKGAADAERTFHLLWDLRDAAHDARPALTAAKIVEAGIRVADTEGLAALSMQRVAGELGYTAMSLYRHVPGKDQLIALMVDAAHGPPPGDAGDGWRAGIERWSDAAWDLYRRHRWMLRVATTNAPIGPNELAWFEALLRPLSQTGLPGEELVALAMFVSSAVRDLARIATELVPTGPGYGRLLEEVMDPVRFPTLLSLTATPALDDDGQVKPAFDYGLQRLLDGIEAHRAR